MPKKLTNDEFILKAKLIHGDKYNYSLTEYTGIYNKIKIICKKHGIFEQVSNDHLCGCGCKKCLSEINEKNHSKTQAEFINISNQTHSKKYNYCLSEYKNNKTKIKIICPTHGIFEQRADTHMHGADCPKCRNPYKNKTKELFNNFIKISNEIHLNKYDYSLVDYQFAHKKITIVCPEHGEFKQTPNAHKKGAGCPLCKESHGERKIRTILKKSNISFTKQKTFNECRKTNVLPFDFYLGDFNTCIEFHGIQHFSPESYFGGEKKLKLRLQNDYIKESFCKKRNIPLLIFFLKHSKSKNHLFVDVYDNAPAEIINMFLKNSAYKYSMNEYEKFKKSF